MESTSLDFLKTFEDLFSLADQLFTGRAKKPLQARPSHQLPEFPKMRGTLLGSPYNKDNRISLSILGSPCSLFPSHACLTLRLLLTEASESGQVASGAGLSFGFAVLRNRDLRAWGWTVEELCMRVVRDGLGFRCRSFAYACI